MLLARCIPHCAERVQAMTRLHWFAVVLLVLITAVSFAADKKSTAELSRTRSASPDMRVPLSSTSSAFLFEDHFDGANDTTALKARGYLVYYRGTGPMGTAPGIWFQGGGGGFNAYDGPANGHVASNYNTVTGTNTIDNWLVLPALVIVAGDSIEFYERSPTSSIYPDSIRVMYSAAGDSTPEGGTWVQLAAFKTTTSGTWTRRVFAAPSGGSTARFAIRYRVAGGGPSGSNSDYIGIDALTVGEAPANDAQALTLDSPPNGGWVKASTAFTPKATFKNVGSATVSFSVKYEISPSGYSNTQSVTSLAPGATQQVTFASVGGGLAAGSYTIRAISLLGGDVSALNDTATGTISSETAIASFPYTQGFEAAAEDDEGWTTQAVTGSVNQWVRGTPAKAAQIDGAHGGAKAWVTRLDSSYAISQNAALISPLFDFTSLTGNPSLKFWHNFKTEAGWDSGVLEYSTDGGTTWYRADSTLGTGGNFNTVNSTAWYNSTSLSGVPPGSPPPKWSTSSVAYSTNDSGYINSITGLSAVAGKPAVKFRWRFWSDESVVDEGWAIDDVSIDPDVPMTYVSSTATQNSNVVLRGTTNQQVIGIEVVTIGAISPISATQFDVNTTGTTSIADIANAKIFYTGTSNVFSAVSQFGSTVATPSGAYVITGSQVLSTGTNYFWLTYDVPGTATVNNVIDGECTSLTAAGAHTPTVTAPAGSRIIKAALAAGDYTVGLAPLNRALGKNITHERMTRRVMREVPVMSNQVPVKDAARAQATTTAVRDLTQATVMQEVEEEYSVLMENGRPYDGHSFVWVDDAMRNTLGLPHTVLGIYTTITAALADLNSLGVAGHVNFLLVDPTYPSETYPLSINVTSPFAPSASATVTMKPATGISPTVSGASASGPVFRIINTNYITFDGSNAGTSSRDWTITNTSTTSPNVINVGSVGTTPVMNTTIKNCVLINGANTSSAVVVGSAATIGDSGYFSSLTLQNNDIRRAFIGAYINGGAAAQHGSSVLLTLNQLTTSGADAVRRIGLYVQGVNGATITRNTISNFEQTSSEDDRGIWLAQSSINSTIARNEISNLSYTGTSGYGPQGIAVSSATAAGNNIVKNNFVHNMRGDGYSYTGSFWLDNPMGITAFGTQTGVMIYNNSIHLYGNTLNQTDAHSMGISLGTGTEADVRNNAVVNNLGLLATTGYGGTGLFVQTAVAANASVSTLNYNNYYVNPSGSGAKNIGQIATAGYGTLGAWQGATSQEASSVSGDPLFVSSSDLHIANLSSPASNAGVSLGTVTDDFDGNPRGGTPDIGADEFAGTSVNVSIAAGWNLISNPVITSEDSVKELYPTSLFDYGFEFTPTGYAQSRILFNGKGYWGKFGAPTVQSISGGPNTLDTIPVNAGWNLVGSLSQDIDTSQINDPAGIRLSDWFGYSAGYFTATDILSGGAYWVKAGSAGNFIFSTAPAPNRPAAEDPLSGLSRITIVDKNGASQTLYFGTERPSVNASRYSMPPLPPDEAFDARFSSPDGGTMVRMHAAEAGVIMPLAFQSSAYPITVRWSMADGAVYEFVSTRKSTMRGEGSITIDQNGAFAVRSTSELGTDGVPREFALYQNYPNPFNPSTTIRFALPVNSRVTAEVYNTLGQRVKVLVNDQLSAGYHTVEWNGTGNGGQLLGSGVYFVRLSATGDAHQSFSDVRKLMLVK